VLQNPTNYDEASGIQRSPSTWSNSTEDFENTLWKKRHYSNLTNGSIQAIRDYPQPWGPDDDQGHFRYAQHMFKQMSHLVHLMGPNGRPIKELQEILASNTFLLTLYDVLPFRVRSKYARQLAANNINLTMIQGKKHFSLMLNELRIYLHTLEMLVNHDLPHQPNGATPESFTHPSPAYLPLPGNRVGVQAVSATNAPRNTLPRWTCPLKYHEYHTIQNCSEFFAISARERHLRMKRVACFTCFGRGAPCTAERCGRLQDIPEELLCKDCSFTTKADCPTPNYLLCGLAHHKKSTKEALTVAFESWIPQLNLSAENTRLCLNVNFGTTPRPAPQQARMTQ
jgi:hypothetical protein